MADLNSTNKLIDKALVSFTKGMDKVEPKFAKLVVEWVEKFRTTNGNLVRGQSSLDRLSGFRKAIDTVIKKSGYEETVRDFIRTYQPLSDAIRAIHADLSDLEIAKSFVTPFQQNAVKQVTDGMVGSGLDAALVNPIQQILFVSINQGSSLKDTIESITNILVTNEKRQGVLKRQALQVSRDSLGQYEGVVNEAVRSKFKLDAFLYIGSLVKDSRWQCERWVNYDKHGKKGLLLFTDLADEIEIAENEGTGMIPSTTPENFAQNRGGYNCRHTAYPVRSSVYIKKNS